MAIPKPLSLLLLSLFLSLPALSLSSLSPADAVAELESLRSKSPSGVIHLTDQTLAKFLTLTKPPRPYSLVIFFDAAHLRSNPDLHLVKLRSEFALVSASYSLSIAGFSDADVDGATPKLFFCDVEFGESQNSFALFGVSSLPHIRLVGPRVSNLKDSEAMEQTHFSRGAESMAEFIESRAGVEIGPITRPPMISGRQIVFLGLLGLVSAPFLIKKVVLGDTLLHDSKIWMAGAVFVYFFSVSGAMFNVIRGMPMFLTDRADPNKFVFFYQGSGMQLGAEGFAIGSLYTVVGLLMAMVTHGLVRVKSGSVQRVLMGFAMIVSLWAVKKVIYLDNWKTGYSVHGYWPTSWR